MGEGPGVRASPASYSFSSPSFSPPPSSSPNPAAPSPAWAAPCCSSSACAGPGVVGSCSSWAWPPSLAGCSGGAGTWPPWSLKHSLPRAGPPPSATCGSPAVSRSGRAPGIASAPLPSSAAAWAPFASSTPPPSRAHPSLMRAPPTRTMSFCRWAMISGLPGLAAYLALPSPGRAPRLARLPPGRGALALPGHRRPGRPPGLPSLRPFRRRGPGQQARRALVGAAGHHRRAPHQHSGFLSARRT